MKGKKPEPANLDQARTSIRKGNFRAAEKTLKAILADQPVNLEAAFLCGRVLIQLGNLEAAARHVEHALSCLSAHGAPRPSDHGPFHGQCLGALGAIRHMQERYDESEGLLHRALDRAAPGTSGQLEIMGNLGLVAQHLGKHEDALRFLGGAVQGGGGNARILQALGAEFIHQVMLHKASAVLQKLLAIQPDNVPAMAMLGSVLSDCGQTEQARLLWQKAQKRNPESIELMVERARFSRLDGDLEASIAMMEATLAMDPSNAATLFFWAYVADKNKAAKLPRQSVLSMVLEALSVASLAHEDRVRLEFAAGKLLENDKQPTRAIEHYIRANQRVWSRQPMEKSAHGAAFENLLSVFHEGFYTKHHDIIQRQPEGNDRCGEGLIFIVGMPRSGTTLAEQIVTRRQGVHAGGERPDLDRLCAMFLNEQPAEESASPSASLLALTRKLAGDHHASVSKISRGADRFTDKSPRNFMNLGLIACLFPRATIIHCIRNAVDTCLSCYFNHFGFGSLRYSYDQEMLGYYYSRYREMMKVWVATLPLTIHDAVYEDLVSDPQTAIRDLVDHCGFPWDEAFLHPEKGQQAVRTASLAQVKKPIYTDSINRWTPYRKHLKPLLTALGMDGMGE